MEMNFFDKIWHKIKQSGGEKDKKNIDRRFCTCRKSNIERWMAML